MTGTSVRCLLRSISMSRRLRPLAAPFLVGVPAGARVRTRLAVSERDALVLWAVGLHLGCLANGDLAVRCPQAKPVGHSPRHPNPPPTAPASPPCAGPPPP